MSFATSPSSVQVLAASVLNNNQDPLMLANHLESAAQVTAVSDLWLQLVAGAEGTGKMCSHWPCHKLLEAVLHDTPAR